MHSGHAVAAAPSATVIACWHNEQRMVAIGLLSQIGIHCYSYMLAANSRLKSWHRPGTRIKRTRLRKP
jgi:hypothetical protein